MPEMEEKDYPQVLLFLSGKRKCGKDYLASKLLSKFGEEIATIIHVSAPLKEEYAKEHSLDYERLLDSDHYKEIYRADMIKWGERKRKEDPSYFCRVASETPWARGKKIWIICDARRISDLEHFQQFPNFVKIRVKADDATRKKRGFEFVPGVDDAESECGLDHIENWDFIFDNSEGKSFEAEMDRLIAFVDERADSFAEADQE